jgi:hypothetical protein
MADIKKGYTDGPATEDNFNIERYINGLTSFIKNCNTPITMAIQGDWGTGKTSIMSMIKNKIEQDNKENVHLVWFNTWQFSQFNMGDQLPLLMMSKLVGAVGDKNSETSQKVKKILAGVSSFALGYLTGGASKGEEIKEVFAGDFVDQIDQLKKDFQDLINKKAGEDGRVIIFVDDLDRLQPGKAVELLEVLKLFLDCEKCVFVLAIDYGVVSRGVKEKYGDDFSEEKGKSFFDKIIQVPFKMPVADYDITNYVRKSFADIGIELPSDARTEVYVNLIRDSIGNNPRSMKRLFNSYLLLNQIASDELMEDAHNKEILFALLCMQSKFEKMYNYLISHKELVDEQVLSSLQTDSNELFEKLEMDEREISEFNSFAMDFLEVIDTDDNGKLDPNELSMFKRVLGFSAITASNASTEEENVGEYRNIHKEICRDILKELKAKYGDTYNFQDWYRRTHDKACWWVYLRQEDATGGKVRFGYEIKLSPVTTEKEMTSAVTIGVYKLDKEQTLDEITAIMGENPLKDVYGVAPVINDWGMYYTNVMTFETKKNDSFTEIYKLFADGFETIKKWL